MNKFQTLSTVAAASLFALGAAQAQTAYSLDQNGSSLVSFQATGDGSGASATSITTADGTSLSLDALTFRPQTGQLYGYDGSSGSLYVVNANTGVATLQFQSDDLPDGFVAFDTNPNLDAFRFINASGANVVYFPENTANADPMNAGRLITQAPTINSLVYADGYSVTGTPTLLGNGYTNQLPLNAAQGQDDALLQYVLDAATDTLAVLDNNAGTVDFVADADFDFDLAGGFDVFTDGDSDIGYALLTVNGEQSFFAIDLGTFAFTQLFSIQGGFGALTSLVVADIAPVPVPAAALLFLTGAGGFAATRRKKKRAA